MNKIKHERAKVQELFDELEDCIEAIDFLNQIFIQNLIYQIRLKLKLSSILSYKIEEEKGITISSYYLSEFIKSITGTINLQQKIVALEKNVSLLKFSLSFFTEKYRKIKLINKP